MPCFLFVLGAIFPRLLLVILYFFSAWFSTAFTSILYPLLGLFFAPLSTIWYAVVQNYYGGEWSFWPIVGIVAALALDFGVIGGGAKKRSKNKKK